MTPLSFRVSAVVLALTLLFGACNFRSQSTNSNVVQPEATPQNQNNPEKARSSLPPPTGLVNDFANVLDTSSETELNSVLTDFRNKSDIEFVIVTVDTTNGEPIFDYSLALARNWGIGPKDTSKGGGLLLMLAVKERQWRLQVSRNLEKDLPDDVTKKFGDESATFYRQGRYADGITKYVKAIIGRLEKVRGFN